ncbi:hypothetical protein SYNPS1DRAFT_26849 [Syncephalis pseudoplumigaleata]|uniref:PH domain-containing protein n=1 Tax=Syncephalis pseudoplumigaleata TaxID=1712513 RepID=A0A4P9Z6M4_9FUNG|nr:hypothetical protein SYNPS1DRAFT_26849 [Syncephalis pseudoplumigaleata]|eukprot:RKP27501.1 hypothetical protein SYNPS1DRAFT_26849 [Syncephalis pseudoplumigaleata]
MDLHRTSYPLSSVVRGSNVEKRGWLYKWSTSGLRRAWKKRYVVLKGNHLFFFKQLKDDEPVASVVDLDEYRHVWHDTQCKKSRHAFRLVPTTATSSASPTDHQQQQSALSLLTGRHKELSFFAESADDMRAWVQLVQRKLPRAEGNILDSVLRRLDYNKYSRPRSSSDLRSHSSRDSMSSGNEAPSLQMSGAGSSGEDTPHGSLTSAGTPIVGSPMASTASVELPPMPTGKPKSPQQLPMTALERRRMRRTTMSTASTEHSRLSRRRSSPLLPGGGSISRRAPPLRLDFDAMPMPAFDAMTPSSMTTPTFGVISPVPTSPAAIDYDSYVLSLRSMDLSCVEEKATPDALSRMEFM